MIKENNLNSLSDYRSSNFKRNSVVIARTVMRVLALIRGDDIDLDGDVRQSSKILPSPLTIPHWWSSTRCRTGLVSVNRSYGQKNSWITMTLILQLEARDTGKSTDMSKIQRRIDIFKKLDKKYNRKKILPS